MRNNYKYLSIVGLLLLAKASDAQITLTSGTGLISQPAGVVTEIVKKSGITDASLVNTLQAHERVTMYSYVDGFGRPLQSIISAGSPNGKDIIQFNKYDEFERATKSYLPFEASTTNGTFQERSTAETNQASFYTTNTTTNKIAYDTKPWAQADIEQSPMQRLLKQGSVGNNFQTDQHYQMMLYRTNETGDNSINGGVRKWNVDGTSGGTYSANDLTVTEAVDDGSASDPGRTIVFADKIGRVILKRQKNGSDYFDTYYVYDLAGNVSYVIPPKAVIKMNSVGWNVSNVPNLIFSYKYDVKGRVTEKKVPNAQVIYMVYDPLDRVVLVQDGKMRVGNKWHYTKYDNRFRSITEGIYTDATHTSLSSMQSYVDGLSCYASSTTYYETRTNSTSSWYTNYCFPTSGTEERAYYYYDDYDFDNSGSVDYSYTSEGLTGEGTATDKTLGILTGVKTKILGSTNDWLISYTFYDKRYNPIQTKSNNQLKLSTVSDQKTNVIDFAGKITISKEYRSTASSGGTTITVQNTFSYDKMDRLQEIKQSNDGQTEVLVVKYEYNPLGQLVDKKLHSTNSGSSFLQSVDLRYNIRGQLTSINNSTLSSDGGTTNDESNDVWGMNLFYEQEDAGIDNDANWTGMISGVKWKAAPPSGGNTDERSYIFSYDKLYRLTSAIYKAYNTGSSNWTKDVNGFDETVTYDWGGNIATLLRKSVISSSVTIIDNLTYDYGSNNDNNQLLNMTESGSNSYGYRNFTSSSSGYSYDENGNLTADAKKGTTLTYNEQNKVLKILQTASPNKYVEYGYDATGAKLSKTIFDGSTTTTINYIGAFEFDNSNALTHFAMPEGRVRKTGGSTFVYEYFITDHQGNVRVSFEDNSGNAVVRQENSYYPYGMIMAGNYQPSAANNRLYNAGSKWQDDFGGIIDYYSTFFREYDPVLGRFNSVDPKAEVTVELSIYHYAGNNPINFNDPMGDVKSAQDIVDIIGKLWNSSHGGVWTAGNENIIAYFGDNATALFYGTLVFFGFIPDITDDQVRGAFLSGSGGSGGFSKTILEQITVRYFQIYRGDRNLKNITYGDNESQVKDDIARIRSVTAGAFLLAIVDVLEIPITINAIPGFQFTDPDREGSRSEPNFSDSRHFRIVTSVTIKYDPEYFVISDDKVGFASYITLGHELFHVLDIYSYYNGVQNFYFPFDRDSKVYTRHEFSSSIDNSSFPRTYFETRAVAFENQLRSQFGMVGIRTWYGGVYIGNSLSIFAEEMKNRKYY